MHIFRRDRVSARTTAITAVVLLHCGLITWLATPRLRLDRPAPPAIRLLAFPEPAPAAVLPPSEAADPVRRLRPEAPAVTIDAGPLPGAAAVPCMPGDAVAAALSDDQLAMEALADPPPGVRSPAGAIALWNGNWMQVAAVDGAPLSAVRASVANALMTLPNDCVSMIVIGPRLVPVVIGNETTFLVVGSGIWRWADLLVNEDPDFLSAN